VEDAPQKLLRAIPRVDRLLDDPEVEQLILSAGRAVVLDAAREATDSLRARVLAGEVLPGNGDLLSAARADVRERVARSRTRTLRRAINATGVVLHTGLGRAVLSRAAAAAVADAARSHSLLEVNPETGERGSRLDHVNHLLRELTAAESALVVNNNAAAVFLAVSALAAGREVVISRGQLVEIGGSFRIPDVIRSAGAKLVEVGTTNKVRLSDYADAITPDTALLLRVHPSNFRIVGFTEEPSLDDLTALGRERGVPVMDDLGSGALVDLTRYGLVAEPTVHASVQAGAGVVTFSGDKLLGGPQAGLAIGSVDLIARMKAHPLMRVLRVDKMTMAALESTLRLYQDEEIARREIPTLNALTTPAEVLRARAEAFAETLQDLPLEVELADGISQVGGGSLPGEELPTTLICITAPGISPGELARRLRLGEPSVWGRVHRDRFLLDLRTVPDWELAELQTAIERGAGTQVEASPGQPST
jgi:L-seryl-tRNA(Ser) seleniumtransferase